MRTLSIGGRILRVAARDGNPDWPPLLLCNGIGAPLEVFQPFVDALDRRRAIIRFDMPGTGGSPASALPYHLATLPPLLSGLLDQLGYQQADVLGISWGGGLAQQFALSRPDRVRRLVLVATGPGALMIPGHPRVLLRMLTPRRHHDPAHAARIAGELYGGSVRDDPALARDLLHPTARPGPARGYYYQLASAIGWTSLPRLPRLQQPTLILAGDDDPIIPLANARIMHRLIPRSELHIYHGGHLDLATDAEHLAPVVEAFLTAETADGIAAAHDQTRTLRRRRGRAGGLRAHTPGRPADHARPATALPGARSPGRTSASRSYSTDHRAGGSRGTGIIRRPGPRPRPLRPATLLLCVTTLRALHPRSRADQSGAGRRSRRPLSNLPRPGETVPDR
jgi:poly(3-hydroxyalkanoate) depolymerase